LSLADFAADDAVRSLSFRFDPFTVYNPAQALAWSPIFFTCEIA
jgi:hypothetical protein